MKDLCQSLEKLPDGVETLMDEFFRWSYKMCDCDWNQPGIISQWMAFLHTQEELI